MAKRRPSSPPSEYSHIERVEGNLRSDNPDALLHTHQALQTASANILDKASEGAFLLDISDSRSLDSGGLLLTWHAVSPVLDTLKRIRASLWLRTHRAVTEYVVRNLEHFWKSSHAQEPEASDNFLLRRVKSRGEMVNDLHQYAQRLQSTLNVSNSEMALWETQVGELVTNGFQHGPEGTSHRKNSGAFTNIVAGKAYEAERRIEMAVLDLGAGIPRVIERAATLSGGDERNDGALIAHALELGVTSRTVDENQGAGLYGIVQAVNRHQGSLLILSCNGLVCVRGGHTYHQCPAPFSKNDPILGGTLAIIIMQLH